MFNNKNILIVIFLFGLLYSESKIVASDGDIGDRYGAKVAMSEEWYVVSANRDDDNGSNSGSVYVYNNNLDEFKIYPSDGVDGDYFGKAVAIDGNWLVVSSVYDDVNGEKSGSVYVFYFNGFVWIEHTKLLAYDGEAYDRFGYSIDIDDNVIIVGSVYDDDMGEDSGSAYIYRLNNNEWSFEQKLSSLTGESYDFFGISLSVSDGVIAIGSVYDDYMGENSGSVSIFKYNGFFWYELQKIFANDGSEYAFFGNSVDLSESRLVIGSFYDDHMGLNNTGSVYIYEKVNDEYFFSNKIVAFDYSFNDIFGQSVSIYDRWLAVGSLNNDNGINSGSVYLYEISDDNYIVNEIKINASDGNANDEFSNSLAIGNRDLIVGSQFDDELGPESGSVYIFNYLGCNDSDACNYDLDSFLGDEDLCTYPSNGFDCNGNCEYSIDECGICNGEGSNGDANLDGYVNISDIIILVDYIIVNSGNELINDCSNDLNLDGIVNITDLILIIEQILNQ